MTKPSWYDSVKAIFDAAGVPESIWVPIMLRESGGNPNAKAETSQERSYGLFQLNIMGGQGSGYNPADLLDPVTNAAIAAKAIANAYVQYGNNLAQVAIASGHPGPVSVDDYRIRAILALQTDYINGTGYAGQWRAFFAGPANPGSGGGGGSGGFDNNDKPPDDMPHLFPKWHVPFFGIDIGPILDYTLFYGVFVTGGAIFVAFGVYGLVAPRVQSSETIKAIRDIAGTAAKVAA